MALFRRGKTKTGTPVQAPVASNRVAPVAARASDMTVGDYANGIPNIRIGEMIASFFRQMVWVIPLALIGAVGAFYLTKDLKRTYTGEGTIMVQLGDEYVYQPIAGSNAQSSLLQTPDTITLNEVALMKNDSVIDDVIAQIANSPGGLRAFAPEIAVELAKHSEGTMAYQQEYMKLRRMMNSSYNVAARPKSSIVDMAFKHEDPELSVSTLNRLMTTYMGYRRSIFVDGASDVISQRREDTESKLRQNDRAIAAFLNRNTISDFNSEQAGARKRTEDLRAALNTLRAQIVEAERSLASVEDQLRATPETINLYVDDRASNRIAQAELELQQLLAKYLPTSDPVRQKQLEIQELRKLTAGTGDRVTGGRRIGPNPVFQELLTRRNTLQASADSLREKEVTMQRQLTSVDGKLRQMASIEPKLNELLRERETLELRLKTYLSKEQEALLNQRQAEAASENVRVISKATYPVKGRNMRTLGFLGATAAWIFTLLMFALFRVFADPRLYRSPAAVMRVPQADPYAAHQVSYDAPAAYNPAPFNAQAYAPPAQNGPDLWQPAAHAEPAPHYPAQAYAAPYHEGQFHHQATEPLPETAYDQQQAYAQQQASGQHAGPYISADPYAVPTDPYGTDQTNPYLRRTGG